MAIAQEGPGLSRRRACRLVGISRSVVEREPKRARDHARLRERLRTLAGERRRFGYRRLHELLRREGWQVNHKLVERLQVVSRILRTLLVAVAGPVRRS